jgi:hypothetical protein
MKASRSAVSDKAAFPGCRRAQLSKPAAVAKRFAAAAALASVLAGCATAPPAPLPPLVLDAADPVITVALAGVPLRLRVVLDQRNAVELNPDAAARLALAWEPGQDLQVGRVELHSEVAIASLRIGDRDAPIQVARRDRPCCAGVDGEVGPDLLPFAEVRWLRPAAPPATSTRTLPLEQSDRFGLFAPAGQILLRFSATQPASVATAAAGAILAQRWGGRWDGVERRITAAFGVDRPARDLVFAHPGVLAGFRFDRLTVRIADYAGGEHLPEDAVQPGEVVVRRPIAAQLGWAAVTIGADRLNRCAEIVYRADPRSLTLACAFDVP